MAEEPAAGFGELLRQLRTDAGLTQEELAEAARLSTRSVSDLERGVNRTARKETARLLADALQLTGADREDFEACARGRAPAARLPEGVAAGATRTLPRDVASFTGRDHELRQLLDAAAGSGGVVGIQAIGGMAGVGKTAFAVHAAHRLAPRFPDGQVFLALHGHTPGQRPVDAVAALASLLQTTGVPAPQIPRGLEARTGLWRNHMAGKKLLLILDDAVGSEQVEPLLPGTPGSMVIITSRRHLVAMEDAHTISLDTLPPGEATALFIQLAARADLTPSDPAVQEIAQLCGYLPLAIGMVARQLHHHPTWTPADRAADLTTARGRLELMVAENVSVAAAFDLSYHDLSEEQRRLFRRLGLHPGTDIDSYAAAALDGISRAAAQRSLDGLFDNYLLTEPGRGRYRLHDLIHEHARALAEADQPGDHDAARQRLLGYYLHTARAADRHLARRTAVAEPATDVAPPAEAPELGSGEEAAAWMSAERLNLHAIANYAAARDLPGLPGVAIAIAAAMHGFLRTQGHWDQGLALHQAALGVARRVGDGLAQAGALTDLGDMQYMAGEYIPAAASLTRALEINRRRGKPLGEAAALKILSFVQYETGDSAAATISLTRALECFRELGNQVEEASALGYLAVVQQATGDYEAAIANQKKALVLHRDLGNRFGEANALNFLGAVQQAAGDFEAAATNQEEALVLHRDLGNRFGEANALNCLGAVQQATGNYQAAAASQQEALRLYRDLGYRMGEANVLNCLGSLMQATGDYEQAGASLEQALELFRDLGVLLGEAEVLNTMGELSLAAGKPGQAQAAHEQALEIAIKIASPPEEARALDGIGRCHLQHGQREEAAAALTQAQAIYLRIQPRLAHQIEALLHDQGL